MESMVSETGSLNSCDEICSEESPALLTEDLNNLENNLQEMVLTDSLESSFKEINQSRSDEYGVLNVVHYDSLSDDETSSDTRDNVHEFPAGLDHEHLCLLDDDVHGRVMDSQNRRISFLTPVKEEQDSSSEEEQFLHTQRLNRTFPIFGDKEASRHELPLFRRRLRHSRRKSVYSVSSDSGIGEALQESSNTSTSAGSSLCASTSDSSDCNCSTHSCDLSSAAHTDDLEGSSDGVPNEVFCHDLAEGPQSQEDPFDIKGDVSRPQEELVSAVWSKFQNNSQDSMTSTEKQRPVLAPLNFRARRKVSFGDGEGKLDLSASSQESSSSSPSTPSSSCSSSSFVKSFRPLFGRQDSEESSSSVSSGDSILAVPLSPHSPTADNTSPFQFPEVSSEKHCFSEPCEGCDLVLLAEGEQFHVHTAVVAWQCTALLQHLRQTGSKEVVLLNKRAADVLCLLRLLYPSHQQPITEDNVSALVELAHYLSCERVLRLCTTYLIGLAHLHHLCPHRHLPPSPPQHSPRLRSGMFRKGLHADETLDATAGRVCTCADTMVERVLDILGLAASYELEDVYQTYLEVAAKVKATEFINCPRFKYTSTVIRQDVLTSRLTRLERVMDNVSLQKSHLVTCRHQHHDSSHLNYSGPLCLKCSSRRLLQKAQNMG